MCTLVVKVAKQGELINVMEMPTSEEEAKEMFAAALSDNRALPARQHTSQRQSAGQQSAGHTPMAALEDGAIWIDMLDDDGEVISDTPACFQRSDAADVLQAHLGAPSRTVARCLSKAS